MINKVFVLVSLSMCLLFSCKPKKTEDNNLCNSDYDQSALLTNYAENLIIPGLKGFETSMIALQKDWENYKAKTISLLQLQERFKQTYLDFQEITYFDFGPMETEMFNEKANFFPLNKEELGKSIAATNIDFAKPNRYDIGFPAMEFLFFGLSNTNIDSFNASKTQTYVDAILGDLTQSIKAVNVGWQSFKSQFLNAKGTDAGSSLSLIVNALNKTFEFDKRDRVGIPSGVLTLGIKQAHLVEAPNSEISKELLLANLKAGQDFFKGKSSVGDGEGLDDVLEYIKASKDNIGLSNGILDTYTKMIDKAESYPGSLKSQVENDNNKVIELYSLMSKQLVYLKSDMPSVLCIAITYLDNPSDSD